MAEVRLSVRLIRALTAGFVLALTSGGALAAEKLLAGWIEHVHVYPERIELSAKLDTGADNSSLDARSLKQFSRGGRAWVSFTVEDRFGKAAAFEKPLARTARIRRHGGKIEERPVVVLGVCLGNLFIETEVNLVDRSGFDHPMLIGRSLMSARVVVDPSRTFALRPACNV